MMGEKEKQNEKEQPTPEQNEQEQSTQTDQDLAALRQEIEKIFDKVPELKQLMEDLGKEAAEKMESIFTRASLMTNTIDPEQLYFLLVDMFMKAGVELQSKYWPKLVDLIRENDEVAEAIKKTGADISSLAGTLGLMFSTLLPHYASVFITGGITTTLQIISADTQQLLGMMNQRESDLKH